MRAKQERQRAEKAAKQAQTQKKQVIYLVFHELLYGSGVNVLGNRILPVRRQTIM